MKTYASLQSAVADIGSTVKSVLITQPETLSANLTVPVTLQVTFAKGAIITLGEYNLVFNSQPVIGDSQAFNQNGTGRVTGLKEAKPEWWGAKGDGATDDRLAIQCAGSALRAGGTLVFQDNTYITDVTTFASLKGAFYPAVSTPITIAGKGMGKTVWKIKASAGDYYSMIVPYTVGTTVTDLTIRDMTIDQNTTNNALVTDPPTSASARAVIALGGSSEGLRIERVRFNDLSGTNTIIATDHVVIRDCEFLGVGNDSFVHDHSTIYTNGNDNIISGNLFEGYATSAKGANVAIETHGSRHQVINNIIRNYFAGMNITGVDLADSVNNVIDGNIMQNVKSGIRLWSQEYSTHTTGYGLDGISIIDNLIYINQDGWLKTADSDFTEESSGIRVYGSTANLPIRGASIRSNVIVYVLDSDVTRNHSVLAPAIGWITPASITSGMGAEHWDISDNIIINSPINAVSMMTKMVDVKIRNNQIWNAGSAAYTGFIANAYRSAILAYLSVAEHTVEGLDISGNIIHDDLDTSLMYSGVYLSRSVVGTAISRVTARNNDIIVSGSTTTAYNRPYYLAGTEWLPLITHTLQPAETYVAPGSYLAVGSTIYEPSTVRMREWITAAGGIKSTAYAANAPATGTWAVGDWVWNTGPNGATPTIGWICTNATGSGTWVALVAN